MLLLFSILKLTVYRSSTSGRESIACSIFSSSLNRAYDVVKTDMMTELAGFSRTKFSLETKYHLQYFGWSIELSNVPYITISTSPHPRTSILFTSILLLFSNCTSLAGLSMMLIFERLLRRLNRPHRLKNTLKIFLAGMLITYCYITLQCNGGRYCTGFHWH